MPTLRRTAAVSIALAMAGYGFIPFVHIEITEKAMADLAPAWSAPASVSQSIGTRWFTKEAVKEMGDANSATDQGDCTPDKADLPAKPCGTPQGIYDLVQDATFPGNHFDNELIEASNNQLKRTRLEILARLREHRYIAARKLLGRALHAIQDFYSHSNFVELELEDIDDRLGKSTFTLGSPRLAKPTERTCVNPSTPVRYFSLPPGAGSVPKTEQLVLTSGFYPNDHPSVKAYGKCAHGDLTGILGIGKDFHAQDSRMRGVLAVELAILLESSWHQYRYEMARYLAHKHTMKFVRDILDEPVLQTSPEMILGLMGHEESTCKCPDPVTEHQDKPGWTDVSGTKVRESDILLKQGDLVDFQATGMVVWGLQYGLFGRELFTGPQGTVDSGVRINITPPLPHLPIGILYGAIFDEKEIRGTLKDASGIPVAAGGYQIKPLTMFGIGERTRMKMTQSGRLFFGVNDGNLSNNRGCFQVRAKIEWRQ